jgi:predicted dehydrogenase
MFALDYLTQELRFYARPPSDATWPDAGGRPAASGWSAALTGVGQGAMERVPIEKVEPLRAELEAFSAWIRAPKGGSDCPVPAEDALAALEVAERIVESGRTGRVLAMGEPVVERGD